MIRTFFSGEKDLIIYFRTDTKKRSTELYYESRTNNKNNLVQTAK